MRTFRRVGPAAVLFVGLAIGLAACGGSSKSSSGTTSSTSATASGGGGGTQGGTITIAAGTAPLSADQGLDFTTQARSCTPS